MFKQKTSLPFPIMKSGFYAFLAAKTVLARINNDILHSKTNILMISKPIYIYEAKGSLQVNIYKCALDIIYKTGLTVSSALKLLLP